VLLRRRRTTLKREMEKLETMEGSLRPNGRRSPWNGRRRLSPPAMEIVLDSGDQHRNAVLPWFLIGLDRSGWGPPP